MGELISYNEQFEQVVDIIESAKERAYRKVNEELHNEKQSAKILHLDFSDFWK